LEQRWTITDVGALLHWRSRVLETKKLRSQLVRAVSKARCIELTHHFCRWNYFVSDQIRLKIKLLQYWDRINRCLLIQVCRGWAVFAKQKFQTRRHNASNDSEDSSDDSIGPPDLRVRDEVRLLATLKVVNSSRSKIPYRASIGFCSAIPITGGIVSSPTQSQVQKSTSASGTKQRENIRGDSQRRSVERGSGTFEEKHVDTGFEYILSLANAGIIIPAGALDRNTTIRMQKASCPPPIRNDKAAWMNLVSNVISCSPSGLDFHKPVVLWIKIKSPAANGMRMAIHRFNAATLDWDEQQDDVPLFSGLDTAAVNLCSFSTYAVFEISKTVSVSNNSHVISAVPLGETVNSCSISYINLDSVTLGSVSSASIPSSHSSWVVSAVLRFLPLVRLQILPCLSRLRTNRIK